MIKYLVIIFALGLLGSGAYVFSQNRLPQSPFAAKPTPTVVQQKVTQRLQPTLTPAQATPTPSLTPSVSPAPSPTSSQASLPQTIQTKSVTNITIIMAKKVNVSRYETEYLKEYDSEGAAEVLIGYLNNGGVWIYDQDNEKVTKIKQTMRLKNADLVIIGSNNTALALVINATNKITNIIYVTNYSGLIGE